MICQFLDNTDHIDAIGRAPEVKWRCLPSLPNSFVLSRFTNLEPDDSSSLIMNWETEFIDSHRTILAAIAALYPKNILDCTAKL